MARSRHGVAILAFLLCSLHVTFINFLQSPPSRQPAIRRRAEVEERPKALASTAEYLYVNDETMKGKLGRAICRIAQEDKPIPQVQAKGNVSIKNAVRGILSAESFYNNETEESKEFWVHPSWETIYQQRGTGETIVLRLAVEPQNIESDETTQDEMMVMKVSGSTSPVLLGRAIASKLQEYKKIQLSLVPRTVPVVMKTLHRAEKLLKDELPEGDKTKIIFHPFYQKLATDRFGEDREDGFTMLMMELIRV